MEPMLDSANIDILISDLSPYVTHSIWIGKMNHIGQFEKGSDMVLKQAANRIKQGQGRISKQKPMPKRQKQKEGRKKKIQFPKYCQR